MDRVKAFVISATGRLALSYLAVIMVMSIGFSAVFFSVSSQEIERQVPTVTLLKERRFQVAGDNAPAFMEFFQERANEARSALLLRLFGLNIVTLMAGSALSYFLARRTLRPIEANMHAQEQFVGDASHELRTPLTSLQMTNEVALRRPKLTVGEAREVLQANIQEVQRLKGITSSLLQLATSNQPSKEKLILKDLIEEAVQQVAGRAVERKIRVIVEDTPSVFKVKGDRQGLVRALVAILDNAIKYSPSDGRVRVGVLQQAQNVIVSIHDDGPGIEEKDLPHIFDRFYRADASRNKATIDGYGIGLSLAKKIILEHEGDIIVRSARGAGATFEVKLSRIK